MFFGTPASPGRAEKPVFGQYLYKCCPISCFSARRPHQAVPKSLFLDSTCTSAVQFHVFRRAGLTRPCRKACFWTVLVQVLSNFWFFGAPASPGRAEKPVFGQYLYKCCPISGF